MSEFPRLLRFVRPYSAPLLASVVLMAAVGAAQGFMAVLIGPVFDRVLKPDSPDSLVPLITVPGFTRPIYLQDLLPAGIHNVWTMVAVAILATTGGPPAGFCSTHSCIPNFATGQGYIVECADGMWSHSGGLRGACSDHGGER